jgi:hypothetical protein
MSALINRAHNQIQAQKLRSLLASCPLVLVYQSLGNVQSSAIAGTLMSSPKLQQVPSGQGSTPQLHARGLKIKNTIAAASQAGPITNFFRCNNIVLGWELQGSSTAPLSAVSHRRIKLSDSLSDIFSSSTSSTSLPPPSLPQKSLATALDLSLSLPSSAPVALLAGFYQGSHFKLGQLKEWMGLDAVKVHSDLIQQIEGSAMALCSLSDEPLSSFLSSIDEVSESSGGDLLDSLDGMVEQRKSQLNVEKS